MARSRPTSAVVLAALLATLAPACQRPKASEVAEAAIPQIVIVPQDSACELDSDASSIAMMVAYSEADLDGDGAWDQAYVQENRLSTPVLGEEPGAFARGFDLIILLQAAESTGGVPTFHPARRIARLDQRPDRLDVVDRDGDGHVDLLVTLPDQEIVFRNAGAGHFERQRDSRPAPAAR